MMERLADWDHDQFKKVAVKVANMEIAYRAVSFYLNHQPILLPDLLAALSPRLDHARVVKILIHEDHLPLAKPYLIATQKLNLAVVNEAYNDLLIEEEDHVTLRSSLETFDQYDAIKLAKRLEGHELLEFRRISALLYRVSHAMKWEDRPVLMNSSTRSTRSRWAFPRRTDYGGMRSRRPRRPRRRASPKSWPRTLSPSETRMPLRVSCTCATSLSGPTLSRRW